jgi:hypothetical protein
MPYRYLGVGWRVPFDLADPNNDGGVAMANAMRAQAYGRNAAYYDSILERQRYEDELVRREREQANRYAYEWATRRADAGDRYNMAQFEAATQSDRDFRLAAIEAAKLAQTGQIQGQRDYLLHGFDLEKQAELQAGRMNELAAQQGYNWDVTQFEAGEKRDQWQAQLGETAREYDLQQQRAWDINQANLAARRQENEFDWQNKFVGERLRAMENERLHQQDMQARGLIAQLSKEAQGEATFLARITQGLQMGRLKLPAVSQKKLDTLENSHAEFQLDPSYDEQQKLQEQSHYYRAKVALLGTAIDVPPDQQPISLDDDFKKNTFEHPKYGLLTKGKDGTWMAVRGTKADDPSKQDAADQKAHQFALKQLMDAHAKLQQQKLNAYTAKMKMTEEVMDKDGLSLGKKNTYTHQQAMQEVEEMFKPMEDMLQSQAESMGEILFPVRWEQPQGQTIRPRASGTAEGPLAPVSADIQQFVGEYMAKNGVPPSEQEIKDAAGGSYARWMAGQVPGALPQSQAATPPAPSLPVPYQSSQYKSGWGADGVLTLGPEVDETTAKAAIDQVPRGGRIRFRGNDGKWHLLEKP